MTKRVYVIASFNIQGEIQPLWLRLSLAPDAPCYKVSSYICTSRPDRHREYATYRCTVSARDIIHEVGLNYYTALGYWTMTISNSTFIAGEM